jgi:hypothetical protein
MGGFLPREEGEGLPLLRSTGDRVDDILSAFWG